jgi:hypothetical protein
MELFNLELSVILHVVPAPMRASIVALPVPPISPLTLSLLIAYLLIPNKSAPLSLLTSSRGSAQFQDGMEEPQCNMPLIKPLFTERPAMQNFSRVSPWTQLTIN